MKKIIIPLIAVVIVAVAVFALLQSKSKPAPADKASQSASGQQTSSGFDPKNPNFVLGTVTKVSPTAIDFKSGTNAYTAQINSNTQIVKQVKVTNAIKSVAATAADLKTNSTIVVYFSQAPKDGVYTADKVQIIN